MKTLLKILSFCIVSNIALAQSIENTIDTFFDGMHTADTSKIQSVISPQLSLQTIIIKPNQASKYRIEDKNDFLKAIAKKNPELVLEEKILSKEIKIDDDLAIVWAPYEFYVNQKLSHKGTNVFTLVRLNQKWTITSIIDTRKK